MPIVYFVTELTVLAVTETACWFGAVLQQVLGVSSQRFMRHLFHKVRRELHSPTRCDQG